MFGPSRVRVGQKIPSLSRVSSTRRALVRGLLPNEKLGKRGNFSTSHIVLKIPTFPAFSFGKRSLTTVSILHGIGGFLFIGGGTRVCAKWRGRSLALTLVI